MDPLSDVISFLRHAPPSRAPGDGCDRRRWARRQQCRLIAGGVVFTVRRRFFTRFELGTGHWHRDAVETPGPDVLMTINPGPD